MKIQQSSVVLNGQHTRNLIGVKATQASVIPSKDSRDSSSSAQLTLKTSTQQQQRVSASSQVQQAGSTQMHSSAFLAEQMTKAITRTQIAINQWQGGVQESSQGTLLEVNSVSRVESNERLSFEALGQVKTDDGRNIDFLLALDFNRDISEEISSHVKAKLVLVDPIMINLNGTAIELVDQHFEFDLLADGSNLGLTKTAQGSGYLVFDRNNDGMVNDGSELFGPSSGNGFAELRLHDSDGNGWLDENDAMFSQLGVLSFNAQGEAVYQSAASAGLGALYLGAIGSNYNILNVKGDTLGTITQTGVALSEQGQTLLLQEVHLRVEMTAPTPPVVGLVSNNNAANLGVDLSSVLNQSLQRLDLRQWVSQSIQNMPSSSEALPFDLNAALKDMALSFSSKAITKDKYLSLEPQDIDGKLTALRQTLEALRKMQAEQQAQFSAKQPLGVYKRISAQ